MRSIFLAMLTTMMAFTAVAQTQSEADKARDEEIAQRAKLRQYPGGHDESDLKLQSPPPAPTRKVAPAAEEPEKPEPGASED